MHAQQIRALVSDLVWLRDRIHQFGTTGTYATHDVVTQGVAYSLVDEGVEKLHELVERLRKPREVAMKFSEQYMVRQITDLVAELAKGSIDVQGDVKNLTELLETYSERRTVVLPLDGLQLTLPCLEVGQVKLWSASAVNLQHLEESIRSRLRKQHARELGEELQEAVNRLGEHGAWAEFDVCAEPIRAEQRAESAVGLTVDALTFFGACIWDRRLRAYVGVVGDVSKALRQSAVVSSDGQFSLDRTWVGALSPYVLEEKTLEKFRSLGWDRCTGWLKKEEASLSTMEAAILRAVHWYSKSRTHSDEGNRMVNLLMALEAILTPNNRDPIQNAIAEGAAFLLGRDLQQRKYVKKLVKDIYADRSALSHGGRTSVAQDQVEEADRIVRGVILDLLTRPEVFASKELLLDWIEEKRLS